MIRTEAEYREALRRVADGKRALALETERMEKLGLTGEELERALAPQRSFTMQIEEEIAFHERLRRGEIDEIENLHGLGATLIALRIARGLTQRQLAARLGAHESQVSRDERNEYQGVTVERAARILDAMGVKLKCFVDAPIELEPV